MIKSKKNENMPRAAKMASDRQTGENMFTGILNGKASPVKVDYRVYVKGDTEHGDLPAESLRDGKGLNIEPPEFYDRAVRVAIAFSEECYVDSIVIGVKGTGATLIRVLDAEGVNVFAEHRAETGRFIIPGEIALVVASELREFIIEIESSFAIISFDSLDIHGAVYDEREIFPLPSKSAMSDTRRPVRDFRGVKTTSPIGEVAAAVLCEKLEEVTGYNPGRDGDGFVLLEDPTIMENGYRLEVEDRVVISASDERGFVIGVEALIKLLDDGTIPEGRIDDHPCMNFRGVHLYLPAENEYDFAKRLVKYLLSPMGYNYIILEFGAGMRFDSHPEINKAVDRIKKLAGEEKLPPFPHAAVGGDHAVDKATVRDFIEYVRSFGIDVIPEVQSLGHVQTLTVTYPDIAEIPEGEESAAKIDENAADIPPAKIYPHCYCPSNEKSYKILFDILDEILDVVRPRKFVHMGHDEVYQIGVCPVCKKKNPADLYAADVIRYHDYLKARGLRMMIWSDMLQPVTKYRTAAAIDKLPKDIVLLDFIWYFHTDKDIEDNLLSRGFDVVMGNMYSSHYPRFSRRAAKSGITGAELSTWTATNEESLGRLGKLYDILYSANMMWHGQGYDEHLRELYDLMIRKIMPALRDSLHGSVAPSHTKGAVKEETVMTGEHRWEPSVDSDGRFRSIIFSHATTNSITKPAWSEKSGDFARVGRYLIKYTDGSETHLNIVYGINIGYAGVRQNAPSEYIYYRHCGYFFTYFTDSETVTVPDGKIKTTYKYEWVNPHPEKHLRAVELVDTTPQVAVTVKGIEIVK